MASVASILSRVYVHHMQMRCVLCMHTCTRPRGGWRDVLDACRLQGGIQTPSGFMCWPADLRSRQRPLLASNRPTVSTPCSEHEATAGVRLMQ